MNMRKLESLTKEELIELVKHERDHFADAGKMVPEGFKLVPVEPTEAMLLCGWCIGLNGKEAYLQVLAAAPHPDHIPDVTKMVPTVTESLAVVPTDSEMLDWLIEESCTVLSFASGVLSRKYKVIDFHGDDVSVGDTAREAITKAMRGEK